jgi:hypothetical protein
VEEWLEAIESTGEPGAQEISTRWHQSGQLSTAELTRYALWHRKRLHRAFEAARAETSSADVDRVRAEVSARAAAFEVHLAGLRRQASAKSKSAQRTPHTSSHARETVARWFVALLCLIPIFFGVGGTLDGWAVAHGQGDPGTFTATQIGHCGKGCDFLGDFTPAGSITPVMNDVNPMGGLDVHQVGDQVPAVLYDGIVFPPGSGGAWQRAVAILCVGVIGLGLWTRHMLRRYRRMRAVSKT